MANLLKYLSEKNIEIGARVPDFLLVDGSGEKLRLSDLKGSPAVLYFYPADSSSGCTIEACEFRDVYQDFKQLDCPVYGISPDDQEAHDVFSKDHDLPFNLCVDPEKRMIDDYGVMGQFQLTDQESPFYKANGWPVDEEDCVPILVRSTFLIDKDGLLMHKWMNVSPLGHASSVRDQLKKSFKFDIAF